jgi:hypothetical protein
MMGWVGVHDPSGLLKKLLQPGSARAADVPATATAAQPMTTATANPDLVNPALMAKPSPPSSSFLERVAGSYGFTVKPIRPDGFAAYREQKPRQRCRGFCFS